MPPRDTKEPAILLAWGAKSPSLRPDSHYSRVMTDSVIGRSPARSPLSTTSFMKPDPKILTEDDVQRIFQGAPLFETSDVVPSITDEDVNGFAHPRFAAASLVGGDAGQDALQEVPSMRSFAGADPGTVGSAYFLQLPFADTKLTDDTRTTQNRADLLAAPEQFGVRPLNMPSLIDRLSELSEELQHSDASETTVPDEQKTAETYTDLFSRILMTPKFTPASESDPTGLEVQMAAIALVLDTPGLWYDFGHAQWRNRLGQLLWSEQGDSTNRERDIALLQILLASELLARMNMACTPLASRALSKKIQWDLVLAQRFLDNVRISQRTPDVTVNRSSVFSALTFVTANETPEDNVEPILSPRNETRQLEGLLKFAEALKWPHSQDIKQRIEDNQRKQSLLTPEFKSTTADTADAYATPMTTPISENLTVQLKVSSHKTGHGGWMSRSWLTGLILPGEAASNFLMAAMLEASPQAISIPDDSAMLHGGFVYSGRSYWSKSCVVGRVLAAKSDGSDCMGWISSPSIPASHENQWIDIKTKDRLSDSPRITKASGFICGEAETVDEDDFSWPVDGPPVMGNECRYSGLTLSADSSTARLTFRSKSSASTKTVLTLAHDVYFVSSQPCFPASRPRAASITLHPHSLSDEKELPAPPCHPLHSGYSMEIVPAATLLSFTEDTYQGREQILVLDCRGCDDLELLARAWCAKVAQDALVGKVERTCLACCVREANALGVSVVIRV